MKTNVDKRQHKKTTHFKHGLLQKVILSSILIWLQYSHNTMPYNMIMAHTSYENLKSNISKWINTHHQFIKTMYNTQTLTFRKSSSHTVCIYKLIEGSFYTKYCISEVHVPYLILKRHKEGLSKAFECNMLLSSGQHGVKLNPCSSSKL